MTATIHSPFGQKPIELTVQHSWDVLQRIAQFNHEKHFVLLDNRVDYFHGDLVRHALSPLKNCHIEVFHANEHAKLVENAFRLIEHISPYMPASQESTFVCIGGGVTLNVGGFISSVVRRGIDLVVVPTTPMAIADVAFGSKHSLNSITCKNYVGTYHDPICILVNPDAISSIDLHHRKRNCIESLKQFLLTDSSQYERLCGLFQKESIDSKELFEEILLPSALQKMDILNRDPFETRDGLVLQFGHFAAHAIEVASGFLIPHDKAVALGIYVELVQLNKQGVFDSEALTRFRSAARSMGVEYEGISFDRDKFHDALFSSKLVGPSRSIRIPRLEAPGKISDGKTYIEWDVPKAFEAIIEWLK